MELRSVLSNTAMLSVGVGAVVIFSAAVFILEGREQPPSIAEVQPNTLLVALAKTELAHLTANGMVRADTMIALAQDLKPEAADAVRETSRMWTQDTGWPENQGIPPPGMVLVRQLGFNGDHGFVTVVVGEIAGSLSCGITVESHYVWRDGWQDRSGSMRMC
jgi:hypothetical protein